MNYNEEKTAHDFGYQEGFDDGVIKEREKQITIRNKALTAVVERNMKGEFAAKFIMDFINETQEQETAYELNKRKPVIRVVADSRKVEKDAGQEY